MRFRIIPLLAALCFLSVLSAQGADKPAIELSGGFSSLASGSCCLPITGTTPVGWDGTVSVRLRDWFSIVGDAGGDYETIQWQPIPGLPVPIEQSHIYAFMGGPKVILRATNKVRLFGQVLLGGVHRDWTATHAFDPVVTSGTVSQFAWQPGCGMEFSVAPRWGVRFEGDYRLTPMVGLTGSRSAITQPRFSSGLVFRP